ncbi:unnamed protein product, partial [Staurois parvus]
MKLSELFTSLELAGRPQSHRMEEGKERSIARTSDSDNKMLTMGDVSPTFNATSNEEDDLIGDFSKRYCLPVECGKHQDLRYITCDTLAHLLEGRHKDTVEKYYVVDCRYPYEYAG